METVIALWLLGAALVTAGIAGMLLPALLLGTAVKMAPAFAMLGLFLFARFL